MQRQRSLLGRALGASLVLHLLLLFIVIPGARKVWPVSLSAASIFEVEKPAEEAERPLEFEIVAPPEAGEDSPAPRVPPQRPDEFELYDLANNREEAPSTDRAPLSDLDRRAHGGVGEPGATSPGSIGNTTQLVQARGGDRLGSGAPSEAVPAPAQERSQRARGAAEPEQPRPAEQDPRAVPPPADDELTAAGGTAQQRLPPERLLPTEPAPREHGSEGKGEDEFDQEPVPAVEPRITLPRNDSWTLPPGDGGLPEDPSRAGGEVDEGGLSFDTQWYEWGPYAAKMLRAIRRNWQIPEIARLGVSGVVRIRFFIERDGRVTGLTITDESGRPPMDFAARDAIADSSPFDPLPADLIGVDREGVTITFYYNARPPGR